jgi:hypothetical protein
MRPNESLQPTAVHEYEVRPRKDKRGVDLISDALPFGRLWYGEPDAVSNVIGRLRIAAIIRTNPEEIPMRKP